LFADVALEQVDDAEALARHGLKLFGQGTRKRFRQPCSCFDGERCRIYAERPNRCRTFACQLLQEVEAGRRSVPKAEAIIGRMRRELAQVEQLVTALGQTNDQLPLMRRYAHIMRQPLDLSGDPEKLRQRAQLMRAVHRLTSILEAEFLGGRG
jgi:Fe-S-cluster containining protein